MEMIVTGFVVKATVDGRQKVISRKFEVRNAAEEYACLAQGTYPDATVSSVERVSTDGYTAERRKR